MQYASKVRYLLPPSAGAILLAPAPPCTKPHLVECTGSPNALCSGTNEPSKEQSRQGLFKYHPQRQICVIWVKHAHIAQAKIWSFLVSVVLCAFVIISQGRAPVPLLEPVLELLGRIVRRS